MKTYKFKFYSANKNRELKRTINVAGVIYNYCIAVHKRYYRLTGKYLHPNRLKKNIAKRRNRLTWWKVVGSQAVQDIIERIDKAYQLFFKYHSRGVRPPRFKKVKKYRSFTLKQAGYKFLGDNRIKIGKKTFKYFNSREIEGKIKTLTIKRDSAGDMFFCVVTDSVSSNLVPMSGKAAGFDFGLKTFLTVSGDAKDIHSPLFFKKGSREIGRLQKILSRKVKGSNQWNKARIRLAKAHRHLANQRKDWFWKLAHKLTDEYDYLFFETLNLKGMAKLWGRKIHDLAFSYFLQILEGVANAKGKIVDYIDPWYPSSKTCNHCDHKLDKLDLSVRVWRCPNCKSVNDRDQNAAENILRVGISTHNLEIVRLVA